MARKSVREKNTKNWSSNNNRKKLAFKKDCGAREKKGSTKTAKSYGEMILELLFFRLGKGNMIYR